MNDRVLKAADAYQALFHGPVAADVMEELSVFCYANRSTVPMGNVSGTNASEQMLVLEGRRQVWLHIQQLLNFNRGDEVQQFALKADQ